ncbi:endopeptidase La [Candidatus Cryosericum odellii]|jgi:ATP-dependent Lon protease|uniref:Lon protease n=1 Tax=Candidatus Cryosericum odellii TaxID=2290917 RepID=A0A398DF68_9BACT|nr:endopeptidase La [Candidatus Cryosericum odellii]RIE09527.1 endopeptidase La [Candidatus Cryosericum odellii]RIE13380.1 endopeptidase La [Candidatus Cryosericum odellii]
MSERDWELSEAPLIPLRNVVVFPYHVLPLFVGRPKSLKSIESALAGNRKIVLVCQKDESNEDPGLADLYDIGVGAEILQLLKLPDGSDRVLVEGVRRVRITNVRSDDNEMLVASVEPLPADEKTSTERQALMRVVLDQFSQYVELSRKLPSETVNNVSGVTEPDRFADLVASSLLLGTEDRQALLAISDAEERLHRIAELLAKEIYVLELARKIESDVKAKIDQSQREYYLREQVRAIEKELGEEGEEAGEVGEYRQKLEKIHMPAYARDKIEEELARLAKTPAMSPESSIIRTYLDWLIGLPWDIRTADKIDLKRARKVLDKDHYGLEEIKDRILEYLAVRKLSDKAKGPILCFVGPPGVGKTSLGKSIAETLDRKFVHVSLGGIRDEAEVRGHRRTYVGAMPGRIIQGIKQAGTKNPVFLLDEIDKVGADFRGDPTAALLEALDPEQNTQFSDHYIEIPFDLSEVLFLTTANVSETIPSALLDRMEVISLPGYTDEEKQQIARHFLLPKAMQQHGLKKEDLVIDDRAVLAIIQQYTREAGVRGLERSLVRICRKVARAKVEEKKSFTGATVHADGLAAYLDLAPYSYTSLIKEARVGVACGLVVTQYGGDTVYVESTRMDGKGNLQLTGQLGDVMKESAQAALSYIRTHAVDIGLDPHFIEKTDLHVHVPEGAVPKEGPSAGVTMATAMVSALTGRKVRSDIAMTGEITLRGQVLPVGGIKAKVLGAYRAGIRKLILPEENRRDTSKISPDISKKLEFTFVNDIAQVLDKALLPAGTASGSKRRR